MSNYNSNSNGDRTFLATSIKGLEDASGSGLPLGHAYLIRSEVRMPELYPLLGELVFGSRPSLSSLPAGNESVGAEGASGLNVIGMFVDDNRETLFMNLYNELKNSENVTDDFLIELCNSDRPLPIPRTAVWMDTFGKFGDIFKAIDLDYFKNNLENDRREKKKNLLDTMDWQSHSLLGAGNPMSMFRFVRKALKHKGKDDINFYLLNSLSNLYRNLGLSETSAFLKVVLNICIWSGEEEEDKSLLGAKQGIFFAVLQKGVMTRVEEEYLASFFDGIINVTADTFNNGSLRIPVIQVETLPENIKLPGKIWYVPNMYKSDIDIYFEETGDDGVFIKIYRNPKDGVVDKKRESADHATIL